MSRAKIRMAKYLKDAKEKFKKEASEENPDPLAPNPYQKGTEEYDKHQMDCVKSYQNMLARYEKSSGMQDETKMKEIKKFFESPANREQYWKDFKEQIAAQQELLREVYGDPNADANVKTEPDAE